MIAYFITQTLRNIIQLNLNQNETPFIPRKLLRLQNGDHVVLASMCLRYPLQIEIAFTFAYFIIRMLYSASHELCIRFIFHFVLLLILPIFFRHYFDVSNHQPHDCLLNRLFRRRSKKTLKLRVTGLCVGNSPVIGEFPAQMVSNAENVSIWWHHLDSIKCSSTLGQLLDHTVARRK